MSYLIDNPGRVAALAAGHLQMTAAALIIASAIALPLGTVAARRARLGSAITGALSVAYTIPSLALMIMFIGTIGLNRANVVAALVFYSQTILVRNVIAGLQGVDPAVIEAARGMGMSPMQMWRRVELPLAAPVIVAGLRLAAVVSIAIATIGAKFNAGGLGTLLFDGVQQGRYDKIVAGAVAVALLALLTNVGLVGLERAIDPRRKVMRARSRTTMAP